MLTFLAKYPEFALKLDLNINVAPIAFYANTLGISAFVPRSRLISRIGSLYSGPALPVLPLLDAFGSLLCTVLFLVRFASKFTIMRLVLIVEWFHLNKSKN